MNTVYTSPVLGGEYIISGSSQSQKNKTLAQRYSSMIEQYFKNQCAPLTKYDIELLKRRNKMTKKKRANEQMGREIDALKANLNNVVTTEASKLWTPLNLINDTVEIVEFDRDGTDIYFVKRNGNTGWLSAFYMGEVKKETKELTPEFDNKDALYRYVLENYKKINKELLTDKKD